MFWHLTECKPKIILLLIGVKWPEKDWYTVKQNRQPTKIFGRKINKTDIIPIEIN